MKREWTTMLAFVAVGMLIVGRGGAIAGTILLITALVVQRLNLLPDRLRFPSMRAVPATAGGWSGPVWRPASVSRTRGGWRPAMALARVETRKMLLSAPVIVAGMLMVGSYIASRNDTPTERFGNLTGSAIWTGVAVFVVAHLAVTRPRRSGAVELEDHTPTDLRAQTTAVSLAVGATALASLVVVMGGTLAYDVFLDWDRIVGPPTWAELVAGPLAVLGGGLFGVMVGRWVPFRIAAGVGVVALVFGTIAAYNIKNSAGLFSPYPDWVDWDTHVRRPEIAADGPEWHALYLVGLCLMAFVGAQLRHAEHRVRWLGIGAVVTLVTIGAGWAQLA